MRPLVIEAGRNRLIFTPETGALKQEFDGSGLIQFLDPDDCHALAALLILSAKVRKAQAIEARSAGTT